MEKTVKKNYYLTPAVKVVAFQVEGGFAGSPLTQLKVGDEIATPSALYGTSEVQSQGSWSGEYINH